MYRKLLKNDITNNIFQSLNIAFFIMLSVAFLSAAGQLTVQLTTSIEHLFQTAKTPHLLQMHTGEIDLVRMREFVSSHPEIETFQVLDFLNIDNALLSFNDNSLKDSVYDNGFSVQSPEFDYLLDLKDEIIQTKAGEVYVPIFYSTAGLAKEGDILHIGNYSLRVAGFVRDSQMNSSLSVSRRFIIHPSDYDKIKEYGTTEYLIEFRLKDLQHLSKIENAYSNAGLESDGPPFLTYPLFRIVNAFSDGISIVALLLISMLIISISLLCIRLTLLAKLEEDYRELAVLKALGIPLADIKKIFLCKYLFIAAVASFVGFLLSFVIKQPLLNNMKMFFGETKASIGIYVVGASLSLLVFLIICLSMNRLAKKLKDLQLNPAFDNQKEGKHLSLSALPQSLLPAISDLLARKKIYSTMIVVLILSIFVLTIPMSIYSTISNRDFVNYLGLGSYDIRIDLAQIAGKEKDIDGLISQLEKDDAIAKFDIVTAKMVDYQNESGETYKLWVDFGNQENFPIKYIDGKAPASDDEISISKLKANELSKKVGDKLILNIDGKEKIMNISGIFSDITNGGKTAKAIFDADSPDTIWMIVRIDLKENIAAKDFIGQYQSQYAFAKFSDAQTYLEQIFGNTISMVKRITSVAFFASILLIFLIAFLFVKMLYLKDLGQNALLKAIGFTNREIRNQYFLKSAIILAVGLLIGNLLSVTLGDSMGSGILSLIGIAGVRFVRNPLFIYFIVPLAMLFSTMLATHLGISGLQHIDIAQWLKEDL